MQKKYLVGSLIGALGIIGVWQLAANAQTFSGPKPGCYNPSTQDCNVDGVVWNRSNASIDTAPIQPGNFKISGRAEVGDDIRVNSDGKAIRVDKSGTSFFNIGNWSFLDPNAYINLNVWGNLELKKRGNAPEPKLITNQICLSGDCKTAWPAGGGGGGTVTSVGSGNGLTGGPIVGAGSLALISCGDQKILKSSGGTWACADDAVGGGGTLTDVLPGSGISVSGLGTTRTVAISSGGCAAGNVMKWNGATWACSADNNNITNITGSGGVTVTNGSGPVPDVSLNTVITDARYVKKSGDSMTGTLNITPVAGYGLHLFSGGVQVDDGGITNNGFLQNYGQLTVNNAGATAIAGYGAGYGAMLSGGTYGLYSGSDTNGAGAYVYYKSAPGLAISKSVTLAGKDYALDVWGGNSLFQSNVDINGTARLGNSAGNWMLNLQPAGTLIGSLGTWSHTGALNMSGNLTVTGASKITAPQFCIGASCINSWPAGGAGDLTDVVAGTGVNVVNGTGPNPTVSLNTVYTDSLYTKKSGDTMSGTLTVTNSFSAVPGTEVETQGANNGYAFRDRNNSNRWVLGAWGGSVNLWMGSTKFSVKEDGDIVSTSNKWGNGQSSIAGCTYVARNGAGGATQCAVGQFMAGISMNSGGTLVSGIYCCPL